MSLILITICLARRQVHKNAASNIEQVWQQRPTRHQLYDYLPPIMKTIQVRRTRHAGHCWRSMNELISDVLLWTPHMDGQKQDDQLEHTFSSYVKIRDVVLKTCQRRWTIRRSGERGSGITMHDMMMMMIRYHQKFKFISFFHKWK